jgi:hypothetical protein
MFQMKMSFFALKTFLLVTFCSYFVMSRELGNLLVNNGEAHGHLRVKKDSPSHEKNINNQHPSTEKPGVHIPRSENDETIKKNSHENLPNQALHNKVHEHGKYHSQKNHEKNRYKSIRSELHIQNVENRYICISSSNCQNISEFYIAATNTYSCENAYLEIIIDVKILDARNDDVGPYILETWPRIFTSDGGITKGCEVHREMPPQNQVSD